MMAKAPAMYLIVFQRANYLEPLFAIDFNMGSLSFYIQLAVKSVVIVSMVFPIILTVISVVFAILSIYNAENKDLI